MVLFHVFYTQSSPTRSDIAKCGLKCSKKDMTFPFFWSLKGEPVNPLIFEPVPFSFLMFHHILQAA